MKRTLKIIVITGAILWGALLSSALAQVAQFITSHDDARDHVVARYIESQPSLDKGALHQAVQDCAVHPNIKIEKEIAPETRLSPLKLSLYECLQKKGHPELAHRLQLSDEAMQSVSWPLSLFW
ncbi:hypothetical protein BCT41_21905 [Vibrio splendidus]|uniref:hypothetical protein n=1 Tax=Vibrio splendidus TaxID=29497 RepID=UPI000C81D220|nr:hypothetical protein [Vibrio splendidus]PMN23475.1 hypothetical protein BCT41_21905 [Vibrio splendidus]